MALDLREPGPLRFIPEEIEALIELGDLASAKTVIDWLEERAVAVDRPWALAVAARGRGKLLASSGELDNGVAELERAVRLHDRVSEPFELARTLLALGSPQRRARHKRAARDA